MTFFTRSVNMPFMVNPLKTRGRVKSGRAGRRPLLPGLLCQNTNTPENSPPPPEVFQNASVLRFGIAEGGLNPPSLRKGVNPGRLRKGEQAAGQPGAEAGVRDGCVRVMCGNGEGPHMKRLRVDAQGFQARQQGIR